MEFRQDNNVHAVRSAYSGKRDRHCAAIIENNDLGYVLHEKQQVGDLLSHITSHDLKRKGENCSAFFSDFLALNNYEAKILEKIATINLIKSNSNLFNFSQLNYFITGIRYIFKPLSYIKRLISRLCDRIVAWSILAI